MNAFAPNFAPQQVAALDAAGRWLQQESKSQQVFRLFGFAGTGKTTIARHLAGSLNTSAVYAAYTGKAALMMRRSGCEDASTIHSLIYTSSYDPNGGYNFTLNPESDARDAGLIVVDECSMVDKHLAQDLRSFGTPILVLGDPAQLPPVKGDGFFMTAEPDVMLTEIHRQAKGSPIIQLATAVREGKKLNIGVYGDSHVLSDKDLTVEEMARADQTLVGKNVTRKGFNLGIREVLGRSSDTPEIGEHLICLRNCASKDILNGETFVVVKILETNLKKRTIRLQVQSIDFPDRPPFIVNIRKECFTGGIERVGFNEMRASQQFDFGYVQTVHKAQGSQWPNVVVLDESAIFRGNERQWLYTAITRASERVTIFI